MCGCLLPPDAAGWISRLREDIGLEVEAGRAWVCESYDEIATVIGCKVRTIETTITDYNRFCADGYDAEFLKDKEFLLPLARPPYYVFRAYQGIDTCLGGSRVNHHQQVMTRALHPIPALYAAGVLAGGWVGRKLRLLRFGDELRDVLGLRCGGERRSGDLGRRMTLKEMTKT